jgi:hypothetical protein
MSNGEPDIFAGVVSLIDRYEALESVPCRATADLIASLEGQLGAVQGAGCCDCQVSISSLRSTLEQTQAVPLGQIAGAIARLTSVLEQLPGGGPPLDALPSASLPLPPAPEGEATPAAVAPPSAPAPSPPRVHQPGEACPPDTPDAPEPGDPVKVAADCGAQLHALGGPVAEGTMQMPVYLASTASSGLTSLLKAWYGPVWTAIDARTSLDELVGNSLVGILED